MTEAATELNDLYKDAKTCAELVGLAYIDDETNGLTRTKHGKGFSYHDLQNQKTVDAKIKQRITELVIPPAWQKVWICPKQNGHVLATGIDERGRKQYIYHPKWRTTRDLIKFYRMIVFGSSLPKIRKAVSEHLDDKELSRDKALAAMLWILDNTYIRIGNDVYFEENESVGLTTLTDENVIVAGPVVTMNFKGKSGKQQQITFENKQVARVVEELLQVRGARLFRFKTEHGWHAIESSDINKYLHEITGTSVSAKDFRTWGGTLMAFDYLLDENSKKKSQKTDKALVGAVDQAAAILGNTRTVARASYVHPHLLKTYGHKNFDRFYDAATKKRKLPGLEQHESEQLRFLESLFEEEFDLLKTKTVNASRSSTKNGARSAAR